MLLFIYNPYAFSGYTRNLLLYTYKMPTFSISAEIRTPDERASDLRKSKKVPGVVYGKTQEPISFTLDSSDFLRLYRKAGESNIIDLKVGKVELEVLVHQTQKHPVSGDFTHVDFYAITRGEKLTTKIHLNFVGESAAAREGAIIEELVKEIEVSCLPRNLTDHFDVDLSLLAEEGNVIRFSDIKIDTEKYEHSMNEDDVIASATMPKVVVDEDPVDEAVTGADEEPAAEGEDGEAKSE